MSSIGIARKAGHNYLKESGVLIPDHSPCIDICPTRCDIPFFNLLREALCSDAETKAERLELLRKEGYECRRLNRCAHATPDQIEACDRHYKSRVAALIGAYQV